MASHVHDSVLQTLLLIQKSAGDPSEVTRLARIQERELRHWLFNPAMLGRHADQPETFAEAMAGIEREIEDTYGVGLELILVGDCPMDDGPGRPGRCLPGGQRQRRQVVGATDLSGVRRGGTGARSRCSSGTWARGSIRSRCPPTVRASPRRWWSGWRATAVG